MGRVRLNVAHLFELILGMDVGPNDMEVDIAASLWVDARDSVLDDIAESPANGAVITEHCVAHGSEDRGGLRVVRDQTGEVKAWMAVISYLLLQPEFLQR